MDKKNVLISLFGTLILLIFIFICLNLNDNAKTLNKDHTNAAVNTTEIIQETDSDSIPSTFGVIKAPVICGPHERLNPRKNICKTVI